MKAIKTVLAASLLAGATMAQAAEYAVTGTLDSFSTNPNVISAIFTPEAPAFYGNWVVTPTLAYGILALPDAYTVDWSVFGNQVGSTTYSGDYYSFHTPNDAQYDAATRTLTLAGTMNNISSNYTCTGTAFFCGTARPVFDALLTVTFTDDSLLAFSGNLVATNDDGSGSQYSYEWSFQGHEVPVPAAAWLFASGLAGLAGFARSRKQ